jgi:hypothetical protein
MYQRVVTYFSTIIDLGPEVTAHILGCFWGSLLQ